MGSNDGGHMTPAELQTFVPEGHEIVMMLDSKEGCRVFTSSKPGDTRWEHEVLIPREILLRVDHALGFPTIPGPSSRAA